MKKFITNSIIFICIITAIHISLAFLADGSTDDYYKKLASPRQASLILGTSRALQGIMPTVVDSVIGNHKNHLYNFAFTINSSPFGEVYYNAVKKKLLKTSKGAYFIVTVDPWSISEEKTLDHSEFDEHSVLKGMSVFSEEPNYEYLIKKYPFGWGMIAFNKMTLAILKYNSKYLNSSVQGSFTEVDDTGYLNVYTSMDSLFVQRKEKKKFNSYKNSSKSNFFSGYRYSYLIKTIKHLKKHGKVYLVRLPVHQKMLEIENRFMVDFDKKLLSAINLSDGYLDMNCSGSDGYKFTDGNHLYKESAKDVSVKIGKWINQLHY